MAAAGSCATPLLRLQMKNAGSDVLELRQCGIPARHDANTAHMHHKFAIVDNALLINGSFNWYAHPTPCVSGLAAGCHCACSLAR